MDKIFIGEIYKEGREIGGLLVKNYFLSKYLNEKNYKIIDTYTRQKKNSLDITFYIKRILQLMHIYWLIKTKKHTKIIVSTHWKLAIFLSSLSDEKIYVVVGNKNLRGLKKDKRFSKLLKKYDEIFHEGPDEYIKTFNGTVKIKHMPNFKYPLPAIKKCKISVNGPIKLVYVGEISVSKGALLLKEALQTINVDQIKVELHMYGYLKNIDINLIKGNGVYFHGLIDTIINLEESYQLLNRNYDAFIFPSIHAGEGMAGSLLDAYYSNLPILTSDNNINKLFTKNGIGLSFSPKPDEIFKVLKKITSNRTILNEMATAIYKEKELIMSIEL